MAQTRTAATQSRLCPSPVRRMWQLWIGRYTHIPAVALVTVHVRCYSKAASVGEMLPTRLQDFWANSCFLASLTLLRLLVLLYVSKTKRSIISIILSLIGSAMYNFFTCFSDLGYTPLVPCAVFFPMPANETLCRTLKERGTGGEYQLYYLDCTQNCIPAPNATHSLSGFMLFSVAIATTLTSVYIVRTKGFM